MQKEPQTVFIEYLNKNGLNITPQRRAIVETFLETEGHFTAEQLASYVRERTPEIGMSTVYRTLKLLVDSGVADCLDLGNKVDLYEHAYGHTHHDHLVCTKCGKKVEFTCECLERQQGVFAARHGYELTRHRVVLYGICSECQEKGIPTA
ncbi:Fur family transcriptional regulator [Desulfovibrio sp. JC010]|uniref:Fur family transcriptional regulator n=1 Tax=Desulfovibrio sp. JC010 TaxID=2593641 RepID=UPI0013D65E5F|nr:transcriptional repressor [Desulfovibrio sp. JC010]NDV28557.1 transcriptional repressor [Desulfovibrio sp. JC010]